MSANNPDAPQPSDEALRTAEAWRIVHNHAPGWWNHYARQFPDSKASWQSKRDDCARYCVVEALKIRDTELNAARAEIATLKAVVEAEKMNRLASDRDVERLRERNLSLVAENDRLRSAAPSGDLHAALEAATTAACATVKDAMRTGEPRTDTIEWATLARLRGAVAIFNALASPQPDAACAHTNIDKYGQCETCGQWGSFTQPDAGARGEGTRMHQHPTKDCPELTALIEKAKRAFKAMSPEEKEAQYKAQRESWVRGEMGLARLERETAVDAPSPRQAALEAVARAIGEATCAQLRLERVGDGDKQRAYFILPGKALDFDLIAQAALDAFDPDDTDDGWMPIETVPKDGTIVQRQHALYDAPISVKWVPDEKSFAFRGERLNWMEASYSHSWPDRAFTPHWRPLPAPPKRHLTASEQRTMKRALLSSSRLVAAPTSEDAMEKALPALNAEAIKLADAAFEGWRLNYPDDENVQYAWGSIYFHSFPTPWRDLRTHVVQSIFTAGQRAFRAALHDILAEVAAQEPGQ